MKLHSSLLFPAIIAVLCGLRSQGSADTSYSSFFSDNGSFELGSGDPPLSFEPSVFPNFTLSAEITGWTFFAEGTVPRWLEDGRAQDGSRYVELSSLGGLASWTSSARITTESGLSVGERFELVFWAAGGVANSNNLGVGFYDGSVIQSSFFDIPDYAQAEFDALGGLEWVEYRLPFVATLPSMTLFVNMPAQRDSGNNNTVYLDNFSIAPMAVPEPGSLMLAAAGMVMGLRRRRAWEIMPEMMPAIPFTIQLNPSPLIRLKNILVLHHS